MQEFATFFEISNIELIFTFSISISNLAPEAVNNLVSAHFKCLRWLFSELSRLAYWLKTSLSPQVVWSSIPEGSNQTQLPMAHHPCDVSSELCCPGAKLPR